MKLYAFQGYRYNSAKLDAAAQAAPPFDQIDEVPARPPARAVAPPVLPRDEARRRSDGRSPHEHSVALHREWLETGVIARDETPSLYPYAITQPNGSSRLGLCALVGVEPGREGDLWPHEQTVAKSIAERLALLRLTRIDIEPVFYLAEDDGTLERLLERRLQRRRRRRRPGQPRGPLDRRCPHVSSGSPTPSASPPTARRSQAPAPRSPTATTAPRWPRPTPPKRARRAAPRRPARWSS